jgi:hypothetical protein
MVPAIRSRQAHVFKNVLGLITEEQYNQKVLKLERYLKLNITPKNDAGEDHRSCCVSNERSQISMDMVLSGKSIMGDCAL